MAREILLRLKTKNYERAQKLADGIKRRASETLKQGKQLRDDLRLGLAEARKRAELRKRGAALGARGARAAGRDLTSPAVSRFGQALGTVGEAREKGEGIASLFGQDATQQVPAILSAAGQLIPGTGAFAAFVAPILQEVLSVLDERLEKELKKREALLLARFEERRFEADFTRRYEEDPAFAFEQAKLALKQTLAEEKRFKKRLSRLGDLLGEGGL